VARTSDSEFVQHEACPSCHSKDNLARYTDGHAHCFGCKYYEPPDGEKKPSGKRRRVSNPGLLRGEVRPLMKRRISEETCKYFGYEVGEFAGKTVQIANYCDDGGKRVAQKVRFPGKDFIWRGAPDEAGLWGKHLFGSGSARMVVVTEGEIDALSVAEVQKCKWPVVSLPSGAGNATKTIAKDLQWLEGFERVVLMFDMDQPGQEAARECAALFAPGKVAIAALPFKDANECLVHDQGEAIIKAQWNAKVYRPDGLVKLTDLRDEVLKEPVLGLPWAWPTLNQWTYGRRLGEIYAFGAGTGVGKTDFLMQQAMHDFVELKEPLGLFFLEQLPTETAKRLAGKYASKRFHVPDGSWSNEELLAAWSKLEESGHVTLYNSFGATEWTEIKSRIRFLHHSEGVRLFYLDHLTALAAAEDDERRALESIMADMSSLCTNLGIVIHLVSHLATPEGKPHEEGGRVMIRHFKGSRAIGYWCHFMFGLERSQQEEDEVKRSTTTFRCLKDRYTGSGTGKTVFLRYEQSTGLLSEADPIFEDEKEPGSDDF
jgi:twinkle protein